jgi:hypothetical protein
MGSEQRQHVIEKANAGADLVMAFAVEIERQPDLGFTGAPFHSCLSHEFLGFVKIDFAIVAVPQLRRKATRVNGSDRSGYRPAITAQSPAMRQPSPTGWRWDNSEPSPAR